MRLAFLDEYNLAYVEKASEEEPERIAKRLEKELAANVSGKEMLDVSEKLQGIYHENKAKLFQYNLTIKTLFNEEKSDVRLKRIDLVGKYRGVNIKFNDLLEILVTEAEELEGILRESDREIYEEILIGTVGRKIRAKIYNAEKWVSKIKVLMESMETSNGFSLSLNWRQKKAEKEEELSTRALVDILKRDKSVLNQEEQKNLSQHFRSKIASARNQTYEPGGEKSFYGVIREVLDYRKWFEFELEYKKAGEKKRELTDRVFFTFSGGEKAMSMYVPLFSAVVAKYESARRDAPKLIALDEAFAGVDEMNIRDMFRLMVEFDFNFIINSQSLWGDYDTVPALAIYQLIRPENAQYIKTINYIWNGKSKKIV